MPLPEISIFGSDGESSDETGLIDKMADESQGPAPEQRIDDEILKATLSGISEYYSDILKLYYLEGKQQREIADLLGKNVKQMGVELNRARKAFAEELPFALICGSTNWQRLFTSFVKKLSKDECKIFALRYVDKLKAKSIADKLQCEVTEITKQLAEVQQKLLMHLQHDF